MAEVLRVVESHDQVTDDQAQAVFEVLAPLVVAAPDNTEASAASRSVIGRMLPESTLRAVLDWWLIVTTGGDPATGDAYRLPTTIPTPVRDAMDALIRQDTPIPQAQWVQLHRELLAHLSELDDRLEIDWYGATKLPSERTAWQQLLDELAEYIDSLRTGQRVAELEWDRGDFERALVRHGIEAGSRRYREMLKRAGELVEFLENCAALQNAVEPWVPRSAPMVEEVPVELKSTIGPLAHLLLLPVLGPPVPHDAEVDIDRIAGILSEEAAVGDDKRRTRLAMIAAPWLGAVQIDVPALTVVLSRLAGVQRRMEELEDSTEVELALLEYDIDEAERLLAEAEAARDHARRAENLKRQLDRLRGLVSDAPAPPDLDLGRRLSEVDAEISAGQFDAAARHLSDIEREFRRATRASVTEHLESVVERLAVLNAPAALIVDVRREIYRLSSDTGQIPDPRVVNQFSYELERLEAQRRAEVEEGARDASRLLDREREGLSPEDLADLELMLTRVESFLADDDLVAANEGVALLRREIEAHRVIRWTASRGEAELVAHILEYCTQQLHFAADDVRRLYVAVKTKPFVILAGLTGSGKSSIARFFAEAIGATTANGGFRRIAVRPDWIDQSEVLGHVNPISSRFEPGWLAHVTLDCQRHPERIYVVLLDEMNLAPVEQYLAEYLSALEEARSGAPDVRLPLYPEGSHPRNADDWPSNLPFPENLLLIGTINVDETTRALSERVLDRANVLQLSVEVSDTHHRERSESVRPWFVPFNDWQAVSRRDPSDDHHAFLIDLAEVLRGIGIGVGVRAHVELERFVANADGVLDPVDALDLGVLQRIVPKVRGFKRDLVSGLERLQEELESAGCERSARVVGRWLDPSISDDEYLDGTDARVGIYA